MDRFPEVAVVNNHFVLTRWDEIALLIRRSFEGATFNDGFTIERPLWHTRSIAGDTARANIRHVVAFHSHGALCAAFFCIPVFRPQIDVEESDIGWFFTDPELSPILRIRVMDQIVELLIQLMRKAGYKRIVTNMGTAEGARLLARRYGFIHSPTSIWENRWIKEL
jgi:hypothetical protein